MIFFIFYFVYYWIFGLFFKSVTFYFDIIVFELMLLGINLNFLIASSFMDDLSAQLFALFILTVAAAEAAIGLAILVIYYRYKAQFLLRILVY